MLLKITRYEIKKIFRQKSVWVICLVLLFVSMFNIYKAHYQFTPQDGHPSSASGVLRVYDKYSGEMTPARIAQVVADEAALSAAVQEPDSYLGYSPEQYETGYLYAQSETVSEIRSEMERIYFYNDQVQKISAKAQKYADAYESRNTYLSNLNQKIADTYNAREITSFYNTKDFPQYFSYLFSSMAVLVLLVLGLAGKFSAERELEADRILLTSRYGREKTALAKLLSGWVYVLMLSVVFGAADLAMFWYCYDFTGFSQPIYAILEYENTALNMTIAQVIGLIFVLETLGFLVFGTAVMLLSALSRSGFATFVWAACFLAGMLTLSILYPFGAGAYLNLVNPVKLIGSISLFSEFSVIRIYNTPVSTAALAIAAGLLALVLLSAGTILGGRRFISRTGLRKKIRHFLSRKKEAVSC
ncbi:MAG: ABC transporter permease subunit [Oscillospiraceae bacterium]